MMPTDDAASVEMESKQSFLKPLICSALLIVCFTSLLVTLLHVFDPSEALAFRVVVANVHDFDPEKSPFIHPSFDLSLHVDNRGMQRDCWRNITVTVFYVDKVIGWGTVPDFCTSKWASVEAKGVMSHTDVVLTKGLHSYMASQLSSGKLGFDVEVRMLFPKGYVNRKCSNCAMRKGFLLCTTSPVQQSSTACEPVHLRNKF